MPDPEWWAEARRLKAAGLNAKEISIRLERNYSHTKLVVRGDEALERKRASQRVKIYKPRQQPAWWERAYEIHQRRPHLSPAAIGRLVHKERTSVLYALKHFLDPEWVEKKNERTRIRAKKAKEYRARKREWWRKNRSKSAEQHQDQQHNQNQSQDPARSVSPAA